MTSCSGRAGRRGGTGRSFGRIALLAQRGHDRLVRTALVPVTNCLGFLPWSNCPHYDSEEQRRPLYQRLVADGTLAPGYATDDGAALVHEATELVEVVADRDGAAAYRDAVQDSLVDPSFKRHAKGVAAELAEMPALDDVLDVLENLTTLDVRTGRKAMIGAMEASS